MEISDHEKTMHYT